jgi:hypothetical protein
MRCRHEQCSMEALANKQVRAFCCALSLPCTGPPVTHCRRTVLGCNRGSLACGGAVATGEALTDSWLQPLAFTPSVVPQADQVVVAPTAPSSAFAPRVTESRSTLLEWECRGGAAQAKFLTQLRSQYATSTTRVRIESHFCLDRELSLVNGGYAHRRKLSNKVCTHW